MNYTWTLNCPCLAGKESACNAGDPDSIPGSGRSPGEGIGYPLQYSWASLVAQTVKILPAVRETWVRSLCWEDPLVGMAAHSIILAWRIPRDRGAWWAMVHGVVKSWTRLSDFTSIFHFRALEKEIAIHSSILAWRIPRDGGAWWAAVYGVAQSRTRLKRLSSSSSKFVLFLYFI